MDMPRKRYSDRDRRISKLTSRIRHIHIPHTYLRYLPTYLCTNCIPTNPYITNTHLHSHIYFNKKQNKREANFSNSPYYCDCYRLSTATRTGHCCWHLFRPSCPQKITKNTSLRKYWKNSHIYLPKV